MKTTYSDVKNPKRLTWILSLTVIAGYAAYILSIAMIEKEEIGWQIVLSFLYIAGIAALALIP